MEEGIEQHSSISEIFPNSIKTLRLATHLKLIDRISSWNDVFWFLENYIDKVSIGGYLPLELKQRNLQREWDNQYT